MTGLSNEFLFLAFMFGGLGLALGASYFGRLYIYALILAITIYINIAEAKVIDVFGFSTTLGTALFGVLYFSTDLLTERYGKKAAFTAIKLGVLASVVFHLFMQGTLVAQAITGDAFITGFATSLEGVFTVSLRIVAASLFVYALIQSLDIFIYDKILSWTGERMLWLRNNVSTFISQGLDTVLFTMLAFYGDLPMDILWQMMAVGYAMKIIVALSDTVFMYAGQLTTPLDLQDDRS